MHSMRALIIAIMLGLASCGAALATAADDCDQTNDRDLLIQGCTLVIDGHAPGRKDVAYNHRGKGYRLKGDLDRAIADYDRAIGMNAQYAVAYANRCEAYNGKGNFERAIADCDQAIRMNPQFAPAYSERCLAYDAKRDFDRAIPDCDLALRIDPQSAITYSLRCKVRSQKSEFDAALSDCDKALQLDSKDYRIYIRRGYVYRSKGDYERAIADFTEAIRLSPTYAPVYSLRAGAYESLANFERAVADYDQAIKISPNFANGYNNRCLALVRSANYDRALADCNKAIELKPEAIYYNNRGLAYQGKGDLEHAMADFNEAIKRDPASANPHNHRGWMLQKQNDSDGALREINEAIKLDPKYATARERRGLIFLGSGNAKGAFEDFNEVLRSSQGSIPSLWGRGQAYEQQGLKSLALDDYKRAIEMRGRSPEETEAQEKARARLVALEIPQAPPPPVASAPGIEGAAASLPPIVKAPVSIGRRVALVIGNSAYRAVSALPNPKNDAASVAGELTRLGFEVTDKYDLGMKAMSRALAEFENNVTGAEWAFVYYAGHGMELNGKNWLIPIDAKLTRANDVPDEAIQLDHILERLAAAKKLRIVVLDACRNNPFLSRMVMRNGQQRAVSSRGLGAMEPLQGEVIFFAARHGNVALDGAGGNSPFAAALVKHIAEEGVELDRVFRKITSTVLAATGNQQEPFVYGHIPNEDFYFKPPRQ
jgi:tetratricopeptide (TPR) repeat protein